MRRVGEQQQNRRLRSCQFGHRLLVVGRCGIERTARDLEPWEVCGGLVQFGGVGFAEAVVLHQHAHVRQARGAGEVEQARHLARRRGAHRVSGGGRLAAQGRGASDRADQGHTRRGTDFLLRQAADRAEARNQRLGRGYGLRGQLRRLVGDVAVVVGLERDLGRLAAFVEILQRGLGDGVDLFAHIGQGPGQRHDLGDFNALRRIGDEGLGGQGVREERGTGNGGQGQRRQGKAGGHVETSGEH